MIDRCVGGVTARAGGRTGYRHVEYFLAEPALDQAYEHLVAAKEIIDRTVSDARYASPTVTYG